MRRRRQTDPMEAMLRDIESRVLNDIDIRATTAVVLGMALGGVTIAAVAVAWAEALAVRIGPIDAVAGVVVAAHLLLSVIALATRDFRWCCAAALSGGLAAVLAVATHWTHASVAGGPAAPVAPAVPALVTAGFAAASTVAWFTVVARPLGSSHPDAAVGTHDLRRVRTHSDDGTER